MKRNVTDKLMNSWEVGLPWISSFCLNNPNQWTINKRHLKFCCSHLLFSQSINDVWRGFTYFERILKLGNFIMFHSVRCWKEYLTLISNPVRNCTYLKTNKLFSWNKKKIVKIFSKHLKFQNFSLILVEMWESTAKAKGFANSTVK